MITRRELLRWVVAVPVAILAKGLGLKKRPDTILGFPIVWADEPLTQTEDIILGDLSWYDTHFLDGSLRRETVRLNRTGDGDFLMSCDVDVMPDGGFMLPSGWVIKGSGSHKIYWIDDDN